MPEHDALLHQYRAQHDQAAREQLIVRYLPLVKYLAGRLAVSVPAHVESGDLESYGVFGLIDALEKFDPSRGVKFETYASTRIKGAMLDALRAQDPAPPAWRQRQKRLETVYHDLELRLGRAATEQEVAAALGVTLDELSAWEMEVAALSVVSLDDWWHDTTAGDRPLAGVDLLPDEREPAPEQQLLEREQVRLLGQAIDRLPEKERLVITLYYYEELTAKEIAQVLGVTPSRVSQLHSRAVLRLRGALLSTDKATPA